MNQDEGAGGARRRHPRIPARLTVRFGVAETDREAPAENISEGGLYLNTNEVFPAGTQLTLRIGFPSGPVWLRGEVVWAIKVPASRRDSMICGMGVQFVDTRPDWPSFLRRWQEGGPLDASP